MKVELVLFCTAALLLAVIIEALRRRRLSENFALFWIAVGVGALVLSFARSVVDKVSTAVGIAYGPTLVFAGVAVFLLIVCLNLSMHISQLEQRVENLAQDLALSEAIHHRGDEGRGPEADDDLAP